MKPLRYALNSTDAHLPDVLTYVLDNHLIHSDRFHCKEAPFVDPAPAKPELLLAELPEKKRRCVQRQTWLGVSAYVLKLLSLPLVCVHVKLTEHTV